MDKTLYKYLISLDFTESDISYFCRQVPGLEIISFKRAIDCINVVVQRGFPYEDIDGLIFSNPGFLVNDPVYLDKKLSKIDGNIEGFLKENPFLI